jgi:lipopolysaccharide heptosyltransferase II
VNETLAWPQAERILCVRLDGLGDVLMTTPALRALHTGRQPGRVTLLTSRAGSAVAQLVPEVDEVLTYDAPWMKATLEADQRVDRDTISRLQQARFDGAVIFATYSQSPLAAALLCYLADIPLRLAHCHENPYGLLTDWVRDPEPVDGIRHEVRRQLDLVASVGARTSDERLSLRVPPHARERVAALLESLGVEPLRPWIVIHPGATAPSRRYAPSSFAAVADELFRRTGLPIVFAGGPEEVRLVDSIRQSMLLTGATTIALAGVLDLSELVALIDLASVLIANNSGPAHIAAAVGTPVVDLYALTNRQHTPWLVPSRVLSYDVPCRDCLQSVCPAGHNACLQKIQPTAVADAACELLAETSVGV